MVRRKFLNSTCLMEEVQNSAIQMPLYQISIAFVARFVDREWFTCDFTQTAESFECRFHKFQTGFFGEIQAVSRINNRANYSGSFDFI